MIRARVGEDEIRSHVATSQLIGEPVAWEGPIVINGAGELPEEFSTLHDGTFFRETD